MDSPMLVRIATVATATLIVRVESLDKDDVAEALLAWADKNVFSKNPTNVLQRDIQVRKGVATRYAELSGVNRPAAGTPTTFLKPLNAVNLAKQLAVCKGSSTKCAWFLMDLMVEDMRDVTETCKQLAADVGIIFTSSCKQ